jgi:hypothetical protein
MIECGPWSFAVRIGREISEIAHVTLGTVRSRMLHVGGIEMPARRAGVQRRAVAVFMDVEAVQTGRKAGDFAVDFDDSIPLREVHRAADLAVASRVQDRNSRLSVGLSMMTTPLESESNSTPLEVKANEVPDSQRRLTLGLAALTTRRDRRQR